MISPRVVGLACLLCASCFQPTGKDVEATSAADGTGETGTGTTVGPTSTPTTTMTLTTTGVGATTEAAEATTVTTDDGTTIVSGPTTEAVEQTTTTTTSMTDTSSEGEASTNTMMNDCGDGAVGPGEECDDGNDDNFDECSNLCLNPVCGDGIKAGPEACDDGNAVSGDGCGKCLRDAAFVFVTSKVYPGKFGGLAAGDIECQLLAGAAKLPGTYKAWLSDDDNAALTRIDPLSLPYIRPDGKLVADTYAKIFVQPTQLQAPISVTELKEELDMGTKCMAGGAWTGTVAAGTPGLMANCLGWLADGLNKGLAGNIGSTDGGWTEACSLGCVDKARLYCFEVEG